MRQGTDLFLGEERARGLDRIRRVASSGFVEFSPLDVGYLKRNGEWQHIGSLVGLLERPDGSLTP